MDQRVAERAMIAVANHRLPEITVEEVDRYRASKVREGKLSANVVNKTLTRLAQVLEVAVEYGYLDRNPARGRQRRLKATKPKRTWLEPEQVAPLLDAAGAIDADRRSDDPGGRRAMPATLILAGLRIGELIALRWRDIDLASGRLTVGEAKTDAGRRTVDLSPALRDELAAHKACTRHAAPRDPCSRRGRAGRITATTSADASCSRPSSGPTSNSRRMRARFRRCPMGSHPTRCATPSRASCSRPAPRCPT
jgi:integrase